MSPGAALDFLLVAELREQKLSQRAAAEPFADGGSPQIPLPASLSPMRASWEYSVSLLQSQNPELADLRTRLLNSLQEALWRLHLALWSLEDLVRSENVADDVEAYAEAARAVFALNEARSELKAGVDYAFGVNSPDKKVYSL